MKLYIVIIKTYFVQHVYETKAKHVLLNTVREIKGTRVLFMDGRTTLILGQNVNGRERENSKYISA